MHDDLLQLARKALSLGRHMPGELEVYAEQGRTTNIKVFNREIESLVAAEPRGLGVRYLYDQRQGYAYTADLSSEGLKKVLRAAQANCAVSETDPFLVLPEPVADYPSVRGLWSSEVAASGVDAKAKLALDAEAAALEAPEIETVEESVYGDGESRVAIASSRGVEAYSETTSAYLYLSAHARRGEDVQTAMGLQVGRSPRDLKAEEAGREAALKARRLLGASPCPTKVYTVLFDREVVAALLSVVSSALTAEAVQKGRSLFAGKLGQEVAAPQFTLIDDGLHPDGLGTSPFDDEGVPRQTTALIREGRLESFLHNSYTAMKERSSAGPAGLARSTGNAARGSYRNGPKVAPSNLVVAPGRGTLEELMGRVGEGVYVLSITGLHSGANPMTGQFSVGAVGHLIEGGALGRPIRSVTIASDLVSLFKNVVDRAADARWLPLYGSALAPSLAIAGVTVSGS